MLEYMCEEQPSHFLGCGTFFSGNEMCYIIKLIHHHHDHIKSP